MLLDLCVKTRSKAANSQPSNTVRVQPELMWTLMTITNYLKDVFYGGLNNMQVLFTHTRGLPPNNTF